MTDLQIRKMLIAQKRAEIKRRKRKEDIEYFGYAMLPIAATIEVWLLAAMWG